MFNVKAELHSVGWKIPTRESNKCEKWEREKERMKVDGNDDDDDDNGVDEDIDCMQNGLLGNKIVIRFF